MPGSDRVLIGAGLLCAMAPVARLLFSAGSVGPDTIWTDYASQQAPLHEFVREELLAGRFPSWIPWLGCGTPLHASQQAAICYLPVTLPVVLAGADIGLKLSLCLHVALLFAGEYLLARALAASSPAAALAATVAAQSGLVVNHLLSGHVNIVTTASLSPWCFLFLVRLLEGPTPLRCVALGVSGGLMALACMPQVAYYTAMACAAWAAATLVGGFARRTILRQSFCLAGAALLAVLVGAVQLVPAFELLSDATGARDRGGLEFATGYALRPIDLAKMVSPNIMGNPFAFAARFGEYDHFHERVVYLGVAVPLLGAFGLSRAAAARWQYGAALLCGAALVIAFGDETPAFSALGLALPGLFMFRCPGRVFCVVSVLAPLLAARGLDALVAGRPRAAGDQLLALAACALSLGAFLIDPMVNALQRFAWLEYLEFARAYLRFELFCGILLAAATTAALLAAGRLGRKWPRLAYAAVLASTILDVGYHNSWHVRTWPASRLPALPEAMASGGARRFVDAPEFPAFPAYTFCYSRMVPAALRFRWSMPNTRDGAVLPGALHRIHTAIERRGATALAAIGCGHAYCAPISRWQSIAGALPRARLFAGDDVRLCDVPIESIDDHALRATTAAITGEVAILAENPQWLSLKVVAPSSARLVLAELHYPGWHCDIDGRPAAVLGANGVFRSVDVPAGEHRVDFSYRPRSLWLGLGGTVIGVLLALATAILGSVAARRRRSEPPRD